jgi:hypothetical protein
MWSNIPVNVILKYMKCDCKYEMWNLVIIDLKEPFSAPENMKGQEEEGIKWFMPGWVSDLKVRWCVRERPCSMESEVGLTCIL